MTDYTITLSPKTYQRLLAITQAQGVTPEHWIDSQLPPQTPISQPLTALLDGCLGAINSKTQPVQRSQQTAFGEGIAAKLVKQGIHRP
ncbi:MAG: hypothetical protein AAGG51_28645 [Cyanobacteria bacterium P01_G01_bin.54]